MMLLSFMMASANVYYLAPKGQFNCGKGQPVTKARCQEAAGAVLPEGKRMGRNLQVGSSSGCDGGWGRVPKGCSVQTGGDYAPHWNAKMARCPHKMYQMVCMKAPPLMDYGWSPGHKLGKCQGDCDHDDAHCAGNLICYQRDGYDEVPGCSGRGTKAMDYCVAPYTRMVKGCVNGNNIIKYRGKSVAQCKALCDKNSRCIAFEYGMSYGGRGSYKARDCQLQSSANYAGCSGAHYNLDLYVNLRRNKAVCAKYKPAGGRCGRTRHKFCYPGMPFCSGHGWCQWNRKYANTRNRAYNADRIPLNCRRHHTYGQLVAAGRRRKQE